MKINKRKVAAGIVAFNGAMITVASAHPGPIGHTHDDEWPFGPIAFGAALLIGILWAFRKGLKKSSNA